MKIKFDGVEFDVLIGDDGSLDTIILVDGIEHRFDSDFVCRKDDGSIPDHEIRRLAEDVIDSDERYWGKFKS